MEKDGVDLTVSVTGIKGITGSKIGFLLLVQGVGRKRIAPLLGNNMVITAVLVSPIFIYRGSISTSYLNHYSRRSTFLTDEWSHLPPRGVVTLRLLSSAAI
jgi:hypothetical protein